MEFNAPKLASFSMMLKSGKSAVFMNITPSLAKDMMRYNKTEEWHNRPESKAALRRFKAAMERGWVLTGETIIFSSSGRLLNGQHRLNACIETGTTFPCVVVFGIEDQAFKYMDIGTRRTAAHIFAIEDIKNYGAVAAASKFVIAYDRRSIGGAIKGSGVNLAIENDELFNWYTENKRLQDSLKYGVLMAKEVFHTNTAGAALHYICARKNRVMADNFFQMLGDGSGCGPADPEFRLRKILNAAAKSEKKHIHWATRAAYTIMSWNQVRSGKVERTLVWRDMRNPNEPFPLAI